MKKEKGNYCKENQLAKIYEHAVVLLGMQWYLALWTIAKFRVTKGQLRVDTGVSVVV